MKEKICRNIKNRRIFLGYSANKVTDIINVTRKKRGAKPIVASTYYKKENGEIPIYVEELEDIAIALKVEPKFFYQ